MFKSSPIFGKSHVCVSQSFEHVSSSACSDVLRSSHVPSPYNIALDVLHTLSHLSFVMPQFGGVASTSEDGLPELKRAFYMALDVLSASQHEASRFVEELYRDNNHVGKGKGAVSF